MSITVSSKELYPLLVKCIKASLVPMITGSPGQGKSAIVHQIAKDYDLQLIDMRLSQCDPTDLLGFPHIDKDEGKASYTPMSTFPLKGDPLPKGKEGWLLFLDEFNSAPLSVQAAAYKIVLDRKIDQHDLHKNVVIMCAGNKDTDNAIVNRMSTAMQSRMVHFELDVTPEDWLEWALDNGIDYRIRAYINYRPDNLVKFSPVHNDKTFACARTWEFASRLTKDEEHLDHTFVPLLSGTISEGVAREFLTFCDIFTKLPTIDQIIKDATGTKVPDEPSVLYAISGSLAQKMTDKTVEALMPFIIRMPAEFQVITLKEAIAKDSTLVAHSSVRGWVKDHGAALLRNDD